MDLGISGRVALVTAGSKGLGLASALAFAGEGCKVAICSRDERNLAAAREQLAQTGADVLTVQADITEEGAAARVVDATVERFGSLHILVGNVGGPSKGGPLEVSDEQILHAIHTNLLSMTRLVRCAVPHMRAAGWGRICLITANGIKQPKPVMALSATARSGLWGWAKSASHELFESGITINTLAPGAHATEHNAHMGVSVGPRGDPDDFGRLVAVLCSDAAKFVTGTVLTVDGGATLGLL